MPGMTATCSSSAEEGGRFRVCLGFFAWGAFFLASARAVAHSSGADAGASAQTMTPMAKPAKMRSGCKIALRSARRAEVLQYFSICGAPGSESDPDRAQRAYLRGRSALARAPGARADPVRAAAVPGSGALAVRQPARPLRALASARHAHAHHARGRHVSRHADRAAAQVADAAALDQKAVAVGL